MLYEEMPLWVGFTMFIMAMLVLDLGLFQRRPHVIGMKEALGWFAFWVGLALIFNVGVLLFHERGVDAGLEFFAGFLVEKSLSIDNIFVFILLFDYFRVPQAYQHKVLFWGIMGAIILRVAFIIGGVSLMARFHWIIYIFGTFLVATGIGMMRKKESLYDPEKNLVLQTFRRFFPVTDRYEGDRFFIRKNDKLWATPLFIILLAIESSDIIFAVDSIPAILAITPDPFIVYTSNIFAMLGLRALYFAVAGFMQMFHFLHYGFASIILILGLKMLLSDVYNLPLGVSLALIINILLVCVIVSLLRPRRTELKLMFERTERLGLIPFRRLLLIENIIDLGDLRVRDAMCRECDLQVVRLDRPWEENLQMIRAIRFSRYPLVERRGAKPVGVLHVKNLIAACPTTKFSPEMLRRIARPCPEFPDDLPLEEALTRFQSRYAQMAIVIDGKGEWIGIITIEDVLEELVGRIRDEFDLERDGRGISLADALSPSRVFFELRADSMHDAIRQIISRIPPQELSVDPHAVRAPFLTVYRPGPPIWAAAIPYARLDGITSPLLALTGICALG